MWHYRKYFKLQPPSPLIVFCSQENQAARHQKRGSSVSVLRPATSWYLNKTKQTQNTPFFRSNVLPTLTCVWSDDVDGLGGSVEDRSVFGVENSSMFLECSPKSQRALIYWQLQRANDDRKQEVCVCNNASKYVC